MAVQKSKKSISKRKKKYKLKSKFISLFLNKESSKVCLRHHIC